MLSATTLIIRSGVAYWRLSFQGDKDRAASWSKNGKSGVTICGLQMVGQFGECAAGSRGLSRLALNQIKYWNLFFNKIKYWNLFFQLDQELEPFFQPGWDIYYKVILFKVFFFINFSSKKKVWQPQLSKIRYACFGICLE